MGPYELTFFDITFPSTLFWICPACPKEIGPFLHSRKFWSFFYFFHLKIGVWEAYIFNFKKIAMGDPFQKTSFIYRWLGCASDQKKTRATFFFITSYSRSRLLYFDVKNFFLLQKLAALCLIKVLKSQNRPKPKMNNISGCSGPIWLKFCMGDFFYHTFHLRYLGSNSERYHVNTLFEWEPDCLLRI